MVLIVIIKTFLPTRKAFVLVLCGFPCFLRLAGFCSCSLHLPFSLFFSLYRLISSKRQY
nr:MAG TPA: hypothetical protein [Caudoviricetes sp.]DAS11416.1 MAG TPA: hypothetical protein [Caudoviricetes sp.]